MTVTFFESEGGAPHHSVSVVMPSVPSVGEFVLLSSGWWRVASRRWRIGAYIEAIVTVVRPSPDQSDV